MKRALVALIAVSALIIAYPSTFLFAGSPTLGDSHHYIVSPYGNPDLGPGTNGSGGGDDDDKGDADDLAGLKFGPKPENLPGGSGTGDEARSVKRIWWMYFFIHRLL